MTLYPDFISLGLKPAAKVIFQDELSTKHSRSSCWLYEAECLPFCLTINIERPFSENCETAKKEFSIRSVLGDLNRKITIREPDIHMP